MKLPITGTREECAAAVDALSAGFVLREVSTFYLNRGASVLGRVDVEAEPRTQAVSAAVGPTRPSGGPFGGAELAVREALAARLAAVDYAGLVVRTARKPWRCTCTEGPNYLPSCTGAQIAPGEVHVEYLGEAPAYASGTRYHAACAIGAWTRVEDGAAGDTAAVDLDGLAGSGERS